MTISLPPCHATLLAVHVGQPQQFAAGPDAERPWESAIIKHPVAGEIALTTLGLPGDVQADRKHHGGPDKAVLAYAAGHLASWREEFPQFDWQPGAFGENLSLGELTEGDVCIGDVFQLGTARLQISQPRQPCWKLSRRWQLPKLAVRVQESRRTGWYLRVLQEGTIAAGQQMSLVERPHPEWTVAAANDVLYAQPRDPHADAQLARCPALSRSWQDSLTDRNRDSL